MENQTTETQVEQKERVVLGIAANPNKNPTITQQQLFDLMRISETLSNLLVYLKQENLQNGSLKYYFEDDVINATDAEGKELFIEGRDGKMVNQKVLKPDFWQ